MRTGSGRSETSGRSSSRACRGENRWSMVHGPIRATIASFMDIGWRPICPDTFLEPTPSDIMWIVDEANDYSKFTDAITASIYKDLWKKASEHFDGTGMEDGVELRPLKHHLASLERKGQLDKHAALSVVAAGAAWPRTRKFAAELQTTEMCSRCGEEPEDTLHFFWTCKCNALINDQAVRSTQHMVPPAVADTEGRCWWTRGITPKSRYPDVPQVPDELDSDWVGNSDD